MLESRRDQGEFFVLVHVRPGEERGRAATEEGKRLKMGGRQIGPGKVPEESV
jgi:hypothetical protein